MLSTPGIRRTTNPYLSQLVSSLGAAGVTVRFFSFRRALFGHYDVVHLHWPENLVRGNTRRGAAARKLLVLAWSVRLAVTRTPVVRTLHNIEKHEEGGRVERWLLGRLLRHTVLSIRLNDFSPVPVGQLGVTILHGHYRDWFAAHPRSQAIEGGLAFVGLIREYKGVDRLLEAFRLLAGGYRLSIAGRPRTPAVAQRLQDLAEGDERVVLELDYVSDEVLVERVTQAQLVVLPYRELHNSGGALAALSLDRPVLVPRNEVTEALADEVGPGWVHSFEGDLSSDDLARAVGASASTDRSARPDLSAREWPTAGVQHLRAYQQAVQARAQPRAR